MRMNISDFIHQAEAYRLRGQHEEAIEVCLKGLEKRPDFLPGRLILGKCYFEAGKNEEGKVELERVVAEMEKCLPAYSLLGRAYLKEGSLDKALEVLRRALHFFPRDEGLRKEVAALEMSRIRREGLPPSPIFPEEPGTAREEKPFKTVIGTDTLAEIYAQQGHLDKAISIYQKILAREPENTTAREKFDVLRKQVEQKRKAMSRKRVINILERWLNAASSKGTSSSA